MRLGLDRLWLALALVLPALASLIAPLPAVDLAYQVRVGASILATGQIPVVDTFTFTVAGASWVDQQWLAQVVLAAGHALGGWELLAVLRALLVAFAFGCVAAAAMARGASPRTAAILSLLAFAVAAPALALRPQLLGIALFGALLWIVAARDRHPRVVVLASVIVALWANVHGSFFLGPVLLGYAWLDDLVRGRPARPALVTLVVATAATLVNPFGAGVWSYAAGIGADPEITARVSEWQRTSPFTVPGLLFYASAVGAAAVGWRGRAGLRWPDWLWLATLFVIGAWTERGLAWWPLGAAPIVALALATGRGPAIVTRPANRLNTVVVAVLAAAIVLALPWWRPADPLTGRAGLLTYAPSGLALALREQVEPGSRVFAPQPWASWLEWAVPDATYFMDSRFELFPPDIWRDHDAITGGGPAAQEALDRWAVTVVVLPAGAAAPAGWIEAYRDPDGTVHVRAMPVD
jgi:hypothetical protein